MTRKLVIAGLVTVAGATAMVGATATPGQPPAASGHVAAARSVTVRSFVAPRAGWLRAVALVVDATGHPRVTVELRAAVRGGVPTRTVLATGRPAAAGGRTQILLPTPPSLAAGRSYAIVVTAPLGATRVWEASPVYGLGAMPGPFQCTPS